MSRVDIAFFIPTLGGGGAERVTIALARALRHQGLAVEIVVADGAGALLADASDELTVIDLHARRMSAAIPGLARYLSRSRPTALISIMYGTALFAAVAVALSRSKVRLVSTLHTVMERHSSERSHQGIARRVIDHIKHELGILAHRWGVNKVVAVSNGVADNFVRNTGLKTPITTIYNPVVSPDLFDLAAQGNRTRLFVDPTLAQFVSVGRLMPAKGVDVLLAAFQRVLKHQAARLTIIGDGAQKTELEVLAHELRIAHATRFLGFASNPFPYVKNADVFVLSSRREGLGSALIEAVALGTKVVSTACDGPREILSGRPETLVPVDDVEALAQAMIASLRMPEPVPPDPATFFSTEEAARRYIETVLA